MATLLYGRPPAVFDPPADAIQVSPLIPGSKRLEDVASGSVERVMIYAPPGVLERRYVLALALQALAPGGEIDVMAPKDKGGARLKKELESFGLTVSDSPKAHHRRCVALRPPGQLSHLADALTGGALRRTPLLNVWTQPGVFAWDRLDAGSALLAENLPPLQGAGLDLGCGYGALASAVLSSSGVTALHLVDLDRRAIEAARRNLEDDRVTFEWADARTLDETARFDFVVTNPPFHDGGAEDRRLGQAFIRKAAGMLKKGGVLWAVANRHLPYEGELEERFRRFRKVSDQAGYKVFEAVK
jgi:16S rRNA (guanine1207-N2)-methyltransferase